MPDNKTPIRFTAEDRSAIRKQSVGVATSVSVELNGAFIYLCPLSVGQAEEVFQLLSAFVDIQNATPQEAADGVTAKESDWGKLVVENGPRVKAILRDVLYSSVKATAAVDLNPYEVDEEGFEIWFNALPLISTLKLLFPKIIEAQSLDTMLGNSSAPTPLVPPTA